MYAESPEKWPAPTVDDGVAWVELGLLPEVVHPEDNPDSPEKRELGRMLFFDPRLSVTNQMACASCHDPDLGWADGRRVSFGHQRAELARNSPTIQNAGHFDGNLFWDGRSQTLEDLVIDVIENVDEMRSTREEVATKINAIDEYRQRVRDVFGDDEVTIDHIAKAVANFVRSVNGGQSRFDAFLRGRHDALSDGALRGLHLFRTAAQCMNCHHGPMLSDGLLHNTGLHAYGRPFEDLGAYWVTGDPDDVGRFKTPGLRNIARTAPYMHKGLFMDLDSVLRAYNIGMPDVRPRSGREYDPPFPEKSPLLHRLDLTDAELEDLRAFLESLSEPLRVVRPPQLPPDP
jgi:cytochrome c peroxidase